MRTAWCTLGLLALCGLGCGDSDSADDGSGKPDAGEARDGGQTGSADGGGMSPGMPDRTGVAESGDKPTRSPDRTDGTSAGEGDTTTDTQQDGDDGDPVWMDEEDVTGDGTPESVTSLFDDETGDFYVWYTVTETDCTTDVTVVFDGDGVGGQGDGSGRYLIDTTCDDTDDLLGCEFDASGADTVCGVCMRDALEAVWQCIAQGSDPTQCECDVDTTCTDGCNCDIECIQMCDCDVDTTCTDGCDCDFECVFGECACDVDTSCTAGCDCDFECSPDFCACDVDFDCTADCTCDVDC